MKRVMTFPSALIGLALAASAASAAEPAPALRCAYDGREVDADAAELVIAPHESDPYFTATVVRKASPWKPGPDQTDSWPRLSCSFSKVDPRVGYCTEVTPAGFLGPIAVETSHTFRDGEDQVLLSVTVTDFKTYETKPVLRHFFSRESCR